MRNRAFITTLFHTWNRIPEIHSEFLNIFKVCFVFLVISSKHKMPLFFLHPTFDFLLSRKITNWCFLNPSSFLLLMEENNSWMFCKQNDSTLKLLAPTFFIATTVQQISVDMYMLYIISYFSIFVVKKMDVIWAWDPGEQMIMH